MEPPVKLSELHGVSVITFDNPPANALNSNLLHHFRAILDVIPEDSSYIITGEGSIFSAGFDLFLVSEMNKPEFSHFIDQFQRLLLKIKFHPSPTAALINGSAVAGGFVISCAVDYRFSPHSQGRFGLNEKILGFTLPPVPQAIVESKIKGLTDRILNSKTLLSLDDLKQIPFFIECSDNPMELAVKKLNQFNLDNRILDNKNYDRKWVRKFLEENESRIRQEFDDGWWSEKSIAARKKQIEQLKLKN